METEERHITDYAVYVKVLIVLLLLTAITITVPGLDLTALTVMVALAIASTKAGIVMAWFMHLKMEILLFRVLAIMVLLIYGAVILLTFMDYIAR